MPPLAAGSASSCGVAKEVNKAKKVPAHVRIEPKTLRTPPKREVLLLDRQQLLMVTRATSTAEEIVLRPQLSSSYIFDFMLRRHLLCLPPSLWVLGLDPLRPGSS